MDFNESHAHEFPNIEGYRPYSKMLGVMIIIQALAVLAWTIYFIRQLFLNVKQSYLISKQRTPDMEAYDKQYRYKVEVLKNGFLVGFFISVFLCQAFGMCAYIVVHEKKYRHMQAQYNISPDCTLEQGWLFRLYIFPTRYRIYHALWYSCTVLSLAIFMWLFNVLVKAYRKSLNQIRYVRPIIFTVSLVGVTFILSVVIQTAVFGSLLFSVLLFLLYIPIVRNVWRFDKVLREKKNDSVSKVENNGDDTEQLGHDEETINRNRLLISSILVLFACKWVGDLVYTFIVIFLYSILLNPCWFKHVYKIPLNFQLSKDTLDSVVASTEYLIIFRDVMASLYLYGFVIFSIVLVLIPKLRLLVNKLYKNRRTEDSDLKQSLINAE